MEVDRAGPIPLHDHVAADIHRAIAKGEVAPGDRLPLAKEIAAVLGVNKNTALNAMHILRDEGLLEFRRGRGITVIGTPEQSELPRKVEEVIAYSQHRGYRAEEVIETIEGISSSAPRAVGGAA